MISDGAFDRMREYWKSGVPTKFRPGNPANITCGAIVARPPRDDRLAQRLCRFFDAVSQAQHLTADQATEKARVEAAEQRRLDATAAAARRHRLKSQMRTRAKSSPRANECHAD